MIRLHAECYPCAFSGALRAAEASNASSETASRIMAAVAELVAGWDVDLPTPRLGREIQRIIRRETENPDPYAEAKRLSNEAMLALLPRLRARVDGSDDPLETALLLAARANCIDFGPGHFDPADLEDLLLGPDAPGFGRKDLAELRRRLDGATKVLLVCDNAGEIVADRLLVEALGPDRVRAVVRGAPVLNDATRDDARLVGLDELCPLHDTEDDTPGWPLKPSPALQALVDESDVILCKGQGNFETLEGAGERHFFLLKAKCPPVAALLGVPLGTVVLAHDGPLSPAAPAP